MNKREIGIKLGEIALVAIGVGVGRSLVSEAEASNKKNTVTWQVPEGVNKIRVRSWNPDGSKDMDRVLSVESNQTFRIDVVS